MVRVRNRVSWACYPIFAQLRLDFYKQEYSGGLINMKSLSRVVLM